MGKIKIKKAWVPALKKQKALILVAGMVPKEHMLFTKHGTIDAWTHYKSQQKLFKMMEEELKKRKLRVV